MEFRVLGPLEVLGPAGPVALGGVKQRCVLAMLVLAADRVVSVDRLIEGVWGEAPPARAGSAIQVYVHHLRRLLAPDEPSAAPLLHQSPGYLLRIQNDCGACGQPSGASSSSDCPP